MRSTTASLSMCVTGILAAVSLSACGGGGAETVEASDTTIPPLTRVAPTESSAAAESAAGSAGQQRPVDPAVAKASPEHRAQAQVPPVPQDRSAREISEIPGSGQDRSDADRAYLKDLADAGIKIEGVEDQMIGAAAEVCRSAAQNTENYTLEAVAGQLVVQDRATGPVPEIAEHIAQAAKSAYC